MKWIVNYSARSHVGLRRENNEDNLFANGVCLPVGVGNRPFSLDGVANVPSVFAVCDGMGGEQAGEIASLAAVETLHKSEEELRRAPPKQLDQAVQQYVLRAHQTIQTKMQGERSGTTLALVVFTTSGARCFNLGDSKIFLQQGNRFRQITHDHTVYADRLRMGQRPKGNERADRRLTRCIGIGEPKPVEAYPVISGNFRLLICSDGLSDMVVPQEISNILAAAPYAAAADRLVQAALDNGGRDNITVIVLDVKRRWF